MKRLIPFLMILSVLLMMIPSFSSADGGAIVELQKTEWTWDEKNIAYFDGKITFSPPVSGKIKLNLSFSTIPESSNQGEVVFYSVNDKKLTLRKQLPDYTVSAEAADSISFTGCWKTPENVGFTSVDILLRVYDEKSQLLGEKRLAVNRDTSELVNRNDGKIRLRVDLVKITRWVFIAAGSVWILAGIRYAVNRRRKKKEGLE